MFNVKVKLCEMFSKKRHAGVHREVCLLQDWTTSFCLTNELMKVKYDFALTFDTYMCSICDHLDAFPQPLSLTNIHHYTL